MGFINLADKTINAKLVYYGCGMGGKTSSLQAVHEVMCPRNEVQLVSIKTDEDATLLFDFLPIDLGEVEGFKVRIQGFTVPGQPKYRRMRKYVLSGADAVVFVVDSESSRLEENLASLEGLFENLESNGIDPQTIPIVLQYNKRDLEDILSEEQLDQHFRFREDLASFPSVATKGYGVFETFTHAAGLLVEDKVKLYGLGRGKIDPLVVAEGARQKLWEIADRYRNIDKEEGAERVGEQVELTFDDDGRPVDPDAVDFDDELNFDDELEIFTDDMLDVELELEAPGDTVTPQSSLTDELILEEPPGVAFPATDRSTTEPSDLGAQAIEPLPTDPLPTEPLSTEIQPAEPPPREPLPAEPLLAEPLLAEPLPATPTAPPIRVATVDDDEEPVPALLDAAFESNIELVRRFGELDEYKALLERKNRALVEVAQNVVHDLKRPLSVIQLVLSSMDKGYFGELPPKSCEAVGNGMAAVKQMERLIADLLDSSRLDYDGVELRFEEVDMGLLIADTMRSLRIEIEEHEVGMRIEPMPIVTCDPWAMNKVFMNLIGNSIQYRHPERPMRIWVTREKQEDRYLFRVFDNGIGIPSDDIPRLFQRFERGGNTGGISGTGLGLHIIREIMLGHGGDAWVESVENEWTCFYLGLPLTPIQPPHSAVSDVMNNHQVGAY